MSRIASSAPVICMARTAAPMSCSDSKSKPAGASFTATGCAPVEDHRPLRVAGRARAFADAHRAFFHERHRKAAALALRQQRDVLRVLRERNGAQPARQASRSSPASRDRHRAPARTSWRRAARRCRPAPAASRRASSRPPAARRRSGPSRAAPQIHLRYPRPPHRIPPAPTRAAARHLPKQSTRPPSIHRPPARMIACGSQRSRKMRVAVSATMLSVAMDAFPT